MAEASSPSVARPLADQWGRSVALISVTIGLILAGVKILTGLHAGSAALFSDGLENGGDVISGAIVYAGLSLASKPPDQEHPYGHGRYETLSSLAIVGILLLTGAGLCANNLLHFQESHPIPPFALWILLGAGSVKVLLAVTKLVAANRTQSTALRADAWHDVTDLLSTAVAAISVALTVLDPVRFAYADRIGGLVIGLLIIFLSLGLLRYVLLQLLDTMPEPARLAEIRDAALKVPGALGIEKCWARRTGMRYHVDLHLEVNGDLTVRDSHHIAAAVRQRIKALLPWVADVLVHVEPSPQSQAIESTHG